jgi:hypothetical protein
LAQGLAENAQNITGWRFSQETRVGKGVEDEGHIQQFLPGPTLAAACSMRFSRMALDSSAMVTIMPFMARTRAQPVFRYGSRYATSHNGPVNHSMLAASQDGT